MSGKQTERQWRTGESSGLLVGERVVQVSIGVPVETNNSTRYLQQ